MNRPDTIIIHHSATKDNPDLEDARAILRYHVKERGWSDIGYHIVLEKQDGNSRVFPGRPDFRPGAHAPGRGGMPSHNSRSIGICVVGNYSKETLPTDMLVTLVRVVFEYMKRFLIPPDKVLGHREVMPPGYTECPGNRFPLDPLKKQLTRKWQIWVQAALNGREDIIEDITK